MRRRALYDVNMLIALFDPQHVRHADAHAWHGANGEHGWASCPLTQNGLMRIMSQPRYSSPQPLASMLHVVREFSGDSAHAFWADDLSLAAGDVLTPGFSLTSGMLTDLYLLALAMKHEGRLVTLDARIPINAVVGATPAHLVTL
ncbi:MAG: TA system VapC family ribonuclease toxin [Casimicrobium sp.]